MSSYRVDIFNEQKDLARNASQIIASHIDLVLDQRDRAQVALCGGSTPAETYCLLGEEHLPWDRVDVFLGDERWVHADDQSSNQGMLQRTLLSRDPGSKAKFHPTPTLELGSPEKSAEKFESLIKQICIGEPPVFDLIVLGLGDDGHTASLFPGTKAVEVKDSFVTVGSGKGQHRITLTAPVLSAARKVIFLVSGALKQIPLKRLIDEGELPERTPAKLVQPYTEILVLADKAAALLLE